MGDLGKIGPGFFERYVYPHLGADRADVALGPTHGVDFGVIDVDGTALVCATDPVFLLDDIGLERAAWFAVHILLSDVAVSGLPPSHLSVCFNLPQETTDEAFATVWEVFDREASTLDVSVVTGHTARYAGCSYPTIGAGTAMAVGDPDAVVRPDGATPGDRVLVTKGPAIETTGLLATRFEERLRDSMPDATVEAALDRFRDMSPVTDALAAADTGGVTAMHDATEGGLLGAFRELAHAAGVGLEVDRDRVPIRPGVTEVCSFFDIDPWPASSSGSLVVTAPSDAVDEVLAALEADGVPAAEVGQVTDGDGLRLDGEPVDGPVADPFWPAYEAAANRTERP